MVDLRHIQNCLWSWDHRGEGEVNLQRRIRIGGMIEIIIITQQEERTKTKNKNTRKWTPIQ